LVDSYGHINDTIAHGYGISRFEMRLGPLFLGLGTGTTPKKANVFAASVIWYGLVRVMVRVGRAKNPMFMRVGTGGTGIYP